MALAAASRATAQPGISSVDGTIGSDGTENTTVTNLPPVDNPQPKLVQPSWSDAQASSPGNPLGNKELSTKGKALSLLLQAGLGAAAGAAAAVPDNPHISKGLGPSAVAGARVPFEEAEQANTLTQQQLEQQRTKAQIAAAVPMAQAELAKTQAMTGWYNQRGEAVGEHNLKAGDILVDKDGNVISHGADVGAAAQAKQAGKDAATTAAVTNLGGSPQQILSAIGVRTPTAKNVTTAQMYLDANNGDPGAAIKSMNADRLAHATTLHTLIASLRSTASSDNAALKTDPVFSGLTKQRDGLLAAANHELATGELDPNSGATVAKLQKQASDLTAQMSARRAQLVRPSAPAGNGSQGGQPFTHVSSDGRWGWTGSAWVATGK
jgi:hypothetical protein